jgi:hypothetical protein
MFLVLFYAHWGTCKERAVLYWEQKRTVVEMYRENREVYYSRGSE